MLIATSWDDGLETDRRLLAILERYGVRASFALSPCRYQSQPVPNDARNVEKYGMLVRRQDLQMYAPHEVCSHSAHHEDHTRLGDKAARLALYTSKVMLENQFQREVQGIVWPYGVSDRAAISRARSFQYRYGRTTPSKRKKWRHQRWDILPWPWWTPLSELLQHRFRGLALCGHTFELQSEADWDKVERFYRDASKDSRCKLVTLSELNAVL